MVWLGRNLFNTHMLNDYDKREAMSKVRQLVSRYPHKTICPSTAALEKNIGKLRKLAARV
ncbi:Uncharacterised protein [uncultured archaeon]|nr:Uncharacterised protein [uncultured archaeon]